MISLAEFLIGRSISPFFFARNYNYSDFCPYKTLNWAALWMEIKAPFPGLQWGLVQVHRPAVAHWCARIIFKKKNNLTRTFLRKFQCSDKQWNSCWFMPVQPRTLPGNPEPVTPVSYYSWQHIKPSYALRYTKGARLMKWQRVTWHHRQTVKHHTPNNE